MKELKRFFLFVLLANSVSVANAQSVFKKYNQEPWQQHVDYTITVKLNDELHSLTAFEKIIYTNHSTTDLKEIYMHLWPNAYKNNQTAFAKQQLENGQSAFHFAKDEERGWIDSLDFKVNNQPVKWNLERNIDICKITLNEVLKPGQSITITSPFYVQLPKVFSRAGHDGQMYCVTQWYPKPAVYDANGWNPISLFRPRRIL